MQINERAPATARSEEQIAADPETVWEVITDIERWPEWNPDVTEATIDGELARGTVFRWKAGPGTITSTIQQVERPRLIAWTGKTFGIQAVHIWTLEAADGGTRVRNEESWEGLPVRLLRGRMQTTLQESVGGGLQFVKAEAERRASG